MLGQSFKFEDIFYIFSFSGTRYIKNFSYKFQKFFFCVIFNFIHFFILDEIF